MAKVAKVKKVAKESKFKKISVLPSKLKYGGKDLYCVKYDVKKGNYTDVVKFVTKLKNETAKTNQTAKMSVSIKYSSIGHPVSAPFFGVNEETSVRAPYDFSSESDSIECFVVQFCL